MRKNIGSKHSPDNTCTSTKYSGDRLEYIRKKHPETGFENYINHA